MTNKLPLVTQISKLGHEILVYENHEKSNFVKKKDFDYDFIKFCYKIIKIDHKINKK
tara:strand:- start:959 stop:1129 length:171 start_codon:yes stop_codon:yes gene_type:complete